MSMPAAASSPTLPSAADRRRGLLFGLVGVACFSLTLPATRIAVVGQTQLLQPFLTLFASALLLGEPLEPATFVAAGLVIVAIAVGRRFGSR